MTFCSNIKPLPWRFCLTLLACLALVAPLGAQTNNVTSISSPLPDTGASLMRVFGSMVLVIAIFLGGVWLFKNWQRVSGGTKSVARLNIFEVKSIGQRQSLLVVGYEDQRFLVASTPGNISLLTQLPADKANSEPSVAVDAKNIVPAPVLNFAEAFQQV